MTGPFDKARRAADARPSWLETLAMVRPIAERFAEFRTAFAGQCGGCGEPLGASDCIAHVGHLPGVARMHLRCAPGAA